MTIMPNREEFDALTRLDFNSFVERVFVELNGSEPYSDNWHISFVCAELEAVRRGAWPLLCRRATSNRSLRPWPSPRGC